MSANDLPVDQGRNDTQSGIADGHPLTTDHIEPDLQMESVGGQPLASQSIYEAQECTAGEPSDPTIDIPRPGEQASDHSLPAGQTTCGSDSQWRDASGHPLSDDHATNEEAMPTMYASDGWLELRVWAEMFNDSQLARIAATNRAERGGVDPTPYQPYTDALVVAEHACALGMRRCYRRVVPPELVAWQKANGGIGEHLVARLLGHLGHPRHATPHHWEGTGTNRALYADERYERTLAQLWQYCGHGDPTRRVRKGMTADELAGLGKPDLKMIVHLIADRAVLEPGRSVDLLLAGEQHPGYAQRRYRQVYERRRLVTADRLHATECVRCGPSGKPAAVLTPWSKAHQQADALRIVGKEILRDLWTVAA